MRTCPGLAVARCSKPQRFVALTKFNNLIYPPKKDGWTGKIHLGRKIAVKEIGALLLDAPSKNE